MSKIADPDPQTTRAQSWLARLSFVLAGLAVVILVVFAGLKSVAILGVGLAAAAASMAAAFGFLSRRGAWRWLSLAVLVVVPIAVIVIFAFADLLWVAAASAAAWLLSGLSARSALTGERTDWRMPEYPAQPRASHAYLIMNPKSGGGKVEKFDLKRKAEELGADVFLIGGSEPVDVAEVARTAVAGGADLLGVAGGDGTQALVAGVAAEHGIPFMGLCREFCDPVRRVQDDALAEQVEAGAAVHLALDHLDLVDRALDLAGVPVQGEAVGDGLLVVADADGEGAQPDWSSASTAASQASRSRLPVRAVIISANAVTCPASASMCGQRARMAWSWACSSAWRWSGRVSSQRVIWRVFGTAGAGSGRGGCLPEWPDVAADGLLAAGPAPLPQFGVQRGGVGDAFVPSLVQVRA